MEVCRGVVDNCETIFRLVDFLQFGEFSDSAEFIATNQMAPDQTRGLTGGGLGVCIWVYVVVVVVAGDWNVHFNARGGIAGAGGSQTHIHTH